MAQVDKDPYELVARILKVPTSQLTPDSGWGVHPYWDSLHHIEILMAIEKGFGISLTDEEFEKYVTMQDIVDRIRALRKTS